MKPIIMITINTYLDFNFILLSIIFSENNLLHIIKTEKS